MSPGGTVIVGARGLIGTALTRALVEAGQPVIALDIRAGDGTSGAHELIADFCDPRAADQAVTDSERLVGQIDVLINCVASRPEGFHAGVEAADLEQFSEVLRTHVIGTFASCQRFGGRMAQRGGGSIVNFASVYGVVAPDQRVYGSSGINAPASYSAAKGAIIALSRYLAAYWGAHGVRVNTVSPGGVFNAQDPEFVRRYSDRVPLGRMADVAEIVSAVQFLASPGASYVNGQNLVVDGGLTTW